MMKMTSNFKRLTAILTASIAMSSCAHSQEYFATTHCWTNSRTLEDLFDGVDSIALVSIGEVEEVKEWQEVTFAVNEQIKGTLPNGFSYPAKIFSAADPNFFEFVSKTLSRAQAHSSPNFLARDVRSFPSFSDITQAEHIVNPSGATVPKLIQGSCKRVPYLLIGVNYLVLLKGEKIVSVEPVLDQSDYWLGFVRALGENNYWPIYRDE